MAIMLSGQQCELREVVLRDKPSEMITVSPKATVPVLVEADGTVRDESLQIMLWALEQNDPGSLLSPQTGDKEQMLELIARIDGPFKEHLDRYKYATRYAGENKGNGLSPDNHRDMAMMILKEFEERLQQSRFLFGEQLSLADIATAPFVRQFANTNPDWFAAQPHTKLQQWLSGILQSELFLACMQKYAPWKKHTSGPPFPG